MQAEAIQSPPAVIAPAQASNSAPSAAVTLQPAPSAAVTLQPAPSGPLTEVSHPEFLLPGSVPFDYRLMTPLAPWRSDLSKRGIDALVMATMDFSAVSGGLDSPKTGQYLLDLALSANLEQLGVAPGALVFADLMYWNWFGDQPNGVGDYWTWDCINPTLGTSVLQLNECWWQQTASGGAITLTAGKIDANRFFASIPNAGLFVNTASLLPSSMLMYMPTYPNPAVGVVTQWSDMEADGSRGWSARFGVFDGTNAAFDATTNQNGPRTGNTAFQGMFDGHWGPYFIAEAGPAWTLDNLAWRGALTAGGWYQSGSSLLPLGNNGTVIDDAVGGYATLTHALHRADEAVGVWDVFAQVGVSASGKVVVPFSMSMGGTCHAPFPDRPLDSLGVLCAVGAFANNESVYVNVLGSTGGSETTFEAFYQFVLGSGVSIQPDLQYIITPGGGSGGQTIENALIATIRLEIVF